MALPSSSPPTPISAPFLPTEQARFADNEFQNITEGTFRDFAANIDRSFASLDKLNTNMVRGSVFRVPHIVLVAGLPSIDTALIPPRFRIVGMDALASNGTDAGSAAAGVRADPMGFRLIAYPIGPITALVDEQPTTTATVKARWVRTTGTEDEKRTYFEELILEDHDYLMGEVVYYVFPNGATRLIQWRADSAGFNHPVPTGLDNDPIYAPFALLAATPTLFARLTQAKAITLLDAAALDAGRLYAITIGTQEVFVHAYDSRTFHGRGSVVDPANAERTTEVELDVRAGTVIDQRPLSAGVVQRTAFPLLFTEDAHYSRQTDAITFDLTGALPGVSVRLAYYSSVIPVLPSYCEITSGAYLVGRENIMYFHFVSTSEIEVTIRQKI